MISAPWGEAAACRGETSFGGPLLQDPPSAMMGGPRGVIGTRDGHLYRIAEGDRCCVLSAAPLSATLPPVTMDRRIRHLARAGGRLAVATSTQLWIADSEGEDPASLSLLPLSGAAVTGLLGLPSGALIVATPSGLLCGQPGQGGWAQPPSSIPGSPKRVRGLMAHGGFAVAHDHDGRLYGLTPGAGGCAEVGEVIALDPMDVGAQAGREVATPRGQAAVRGVPLAMGDDTIWVGEGDGRIFSHPASVQGAWELAVEGGDGAPVQELWWSGSGLLMHRGDVISRAAGLPGDGEALEEIARVGAGGARMPSALLALRHGGSALVVGDHAWCVPGRRQGLSGLALWALGIILLLAGGVGGWLRFRRAA